MQHLNAIVLATLALTPLSALAATGPAHQDTLYAGVGLGLSQVHPQENGSGWHTIDESSTGFNLYVGYAFNPSWFAELTYADLGEATVGSRNNDIGGTEAISYQIPSLTAGYYFWQPRETVFIYLRAGIAGIINKNTGDVELYEQNTSTQFVLGLGSEWRFTKTLFTRLEITSYDVDAQMLSLSIGYRFNE
jgi:outer membrane protein W